MEISTGWKMLLIDSSRPKTVPMIMTTYQKPCNERWSSDSSLAIMSRGSHQADTWVSGELGQEPDPPTLSIHRRSPFAETLHHRIRRYDLAGTGQTCLISSSPEDSPSNTPREPA